MSERLSSLLTNKYIQAQVFSPETFAFERFSLQCWTEPDQSIERGTKVLVLYPVTIGHRLRVLLHV